MSAVPTGLRMNYCFANPTLKRGANNHRAYGAGDGLCLRAGANNHCDYGAGDGLLPAWNAST